MSDKIVVGLDGSPGGNVVLDYARETADRMSACEILLCYVIEWTPYSFQTAEENAVRHKRREEEIAIAHKRILDPALKELGDKGYSATGFVQHGDAAVILDRLAFDEGARQIIVARSAGRGLQQRIFGSVTGNLVAAARVPVTVIPT